MSEVATIAGYALRESMRRRVFNVVLLLSVAFLALYAVGTAAVFGELGNIAEDGAEPSTVAGATLVGLAMFATLFLGTVLAVFLTLSAVRGDAERGLLQPLVVRPLGRRDLLLGRFLGAAAVCSAYVATLYTSAVLITAIAGDWTPDHPVRAGLALVAAVTVVAALSLLGSVFLSATANGIAVFMAFGAGLVAGLLGQIGEALASDTLRSIGDAGAVALPFEALYQFALHELTAETTGQAAFIVQLGPFGGAQDFGVWLWLWAVVYLGAVAAVTVRAFARRDL